MPFVLASSYYTVDILTWYHHFGTQSQLALSQNILIILIPLHLSPDPLFAASALSSAESMLVEGHPNGVHNGFCRIHPVHESSLSNTIWQCPVTDTAGVTEVSKISMIQTIS